MKHPSTLESILNNLSNDDLSNLEYWLKADGGTLSEGVFLLYGKTPSGALENPTCVREYQTEYLCYVFASRSIDAGTLTGSKTSTGYRVNFNDLFRWAIERNFGNQTFIIEFIHLRKRVQKVWQQNLCKTDINHQITCISEHSSKLTENSFRIYERVIKAREQAISLTLDHLTQNAITKLNYKNIEKEFSNISADDFVKYNKRGCPASLLTEHRCRAIAKTLKYCIPNIRIKEIYTHEMILTVGFYNGTAVDIRTFRDWMHLEHIFDRSRSAKK